MQSSPSLTGGTSGEAATADLSGRCVGNSYVLVCPVGHGATGTVWRGIDRSTGADVAVKLLHEGLLRQPKLVIRFVQERTILMMLRHENIVGVRDLFSVGGTLALVMDYVAGGSLRSHLRARRTLAPAEAAGLVAQVAAALAQAHELGVVHRDVKPDNILLQDNDVRLTDFGIARILDTAGLTTPQAVVGTPHYMAPEAIQGEAVPASDVYSAGILLYELVTGAPPYAGEPLAVLRGHLDEVPEKPDGMPHPVWDLITWCLTKDPVRRPTAAELGQALRDLARLTAGTPAMDPAAEVTETEGVRAVVQPSVRRVPARQRPRNGPRSWMWRRPWAMATLMAGAVAVSGVGGFNAWELLDARDEPAAAPHSALQGSGDRTAGASKPAAGMPSRELQDAARLTQGEAGTGLAGGAGTGLASGAGAGIGSGAGLSCGAAFGGAAGIGNAAGIGSRAGSGGAAGPGCGTGFGSEEERRSGAGSGTATGTGSGSGAGKGISSGAGRGKKAGTGNGTAAGGAADLGIGVGAGSGTGAAAGGSQTPAGEEAGPWRCGDSYNWDLGHPVLARPCYATGGSVQVLGRMEAMPGVQADVSLTLRDAGSDEVVAGPYTCKGLLFTDFALQHSCGPVELRPPHGRRLVVVQTWEYTQRPLLPAGTARGPAFQW
ncbi:serine/threonine-protein kinase [Actinoplanes sp. URMC 104]|uniref:serine/threonine-protein kinase n=1 Tax=Actinoplanes sp. URMC 104 TaxID=3423409 RepID=UPI003F195E66